MSTPFAGRFAAVRQRMAEAGVDALCLSVGPDLPWLCGYEAMPLERLTMLVLPADADATLVVPRLEAPRVTERPELFAVLPWEETDDPVAVVTGLLGSRRRVAVGDTTWARFIVELLQRQPALQLRRATDVTGPLRAVKDPHELAMLHRAGAAADEVAVALRHGEIPLVGRTEAQVSAELSERLVGTGHHHTNFAIVAAGANAASPHHEPGDRVIGADEVVLCDFGGTMHDDHGVGYCSDITRCVWTGDVPGRASEIYAAVAAGHAAAMAGVAAGVPAEAIDALARDVIAAAGYGEWFVHRTGHGIGVEAHEDPYIVAGNTDPVAIGHAFSIEPGIYLPGDLGFRLEDCVAVGPDGADSFTRSDRALVAVDA